ncbi:MAG: GDSL-type esterase/lipase family protein [Rickettsiales bacterium]|nr:GDSL-type esterase/lipase family protein [Rickettsiales bacterium]
MKKFLVFIFVLFVIACSNDNDTLGRNDKWWQDRHQQIVEKIKNEKFDIAFLGDSITHFWEQEGIDSWIEISEKYKIINEGIAGDKTGNLLWRLQNGALANAKITIIMIGTNNLWHGNNTPKKTANKIKTIVKYINKNTKTKIILLSIIPSTDENLNKKFNELNEYLKEIKNVDYLDISKLYQDTDGNVAEINYKDIVHLSVDGYKKEKEELLKFIK